jgi:hypothetical protein
MKLPDELPETPYEAVAFRVVHMHVDEEDDPAYPGTLLLEIAARLPGTEAEITVPFELTVGTAISLVDELLHQYRCVAHGIEDVEDSDEG